MSSNIHGHLSPLSLSAPHSLFEDSQPVKHQLKDVKETAIPLGQLDPLAQGLLGRVGSTCWTTWQLLSQWWFAVVSVKQSFLKDDYVKGVLQSNVVHVKSTKRFSEIQRLLKRRSLTHRIHVYGIFTYI